MYVCMYVILKGSPRDIFISRSVLKGKYQAILIKTKSSNSCVFSGRSKACVDQPELKKCRDVERRVMMTT
jgi:hypothetical protein